MANALLDASIWSDGIASPPASWNGSSYECISVVGNAIAPISQANNVADGDNISFMLDVISPDTSDPSAYCQVMINNIEVFRQSVSATGSFPFTSDPIPAGQSVVIQFFIVSGGNDYPMYSGDFRITPTVDAPFWTDFVQTQETQSGSAPAPAPAPAPSPSPTPLTSGVPADLTGLVDCYGDTPTCANWSIDVPAGKTKLTVVVTGDLAAAATADLWILVNRGGLPVNENPGSVDGVTNSGSDPDSQINSPEPWTIEIDSPIAGTWFIAPDTAVAGLSVTATVT